jgi:hypothetical protein
MRRSPTVLDAWKVKISIGRVRIAVVAKAALAFVKSWG